MVHVLESFSLRGKVAVVTGGAGKYGKQIAMSLSQAGAKTYVSSRDASKLAEIERDYRDAGCEVTALELDQEHEASILAFKDRILEENGRVDVLVNNAVLRSVADWNDPAERFARSMQVNATGLYLVTRAFGNEMAGLGGGSIINVGSIHGMIGPDGSLYEGLDFHGFAPDYFFHKGGMQSFTRFVASYYGKYGIRCNCIAPGGLSSERVNDVFRKRYGERTFLGRMANDTDLMGIAVFLASDASLYVTGATIPVDGGYTAK